MNWLHFALWVTGIYVLYYLVNILADTARAWRVPAWKEITQELTFMIDEKPQVMDLPDEAEPPVVNASPPATVSPGKEPDHGKTAEPALIGSGGVILKDLFGLCRQDALVYTRSVSY